MTKKEVSVPYDWAVTAKTVCTRLLEYPKSRDKRRLINTVVTQAQQAEREWEA